MIKSIIFDFDGVLVDSEILVAKAFSRYMIESGYDFNQNEFSKFAGKKTFQVISDLSDKFSINDEEKFYNDIMNIASNIYSKELTTVKGAFEYVKKSKRNPMWKRFITPLKRESSHPHEPIFFHNEKKLDELSPRRVPAHCL